MIEQNVVSRLRDLSKNAVLILLIAVAVFGFTRLDTAYAATTPSLGAAETYGVLASTYTNTSSTTINGDVGFTTAPAVAPGGVHTNYGSGDPYAAAGIDQNAALSTLNSQPCTFNWGAAVDLSTDITHGAAGVYAPGVYCSAGAMSISSSITLEGGGTYIFRADGALDTAAGSVVTLSGGASACDLFWTPTVTTLGANTTFSGTVIDNSGITVGANTTWEGRALAFGGTVTTDTDTITVPTCAAEAGTISVVKSVINDNDGTKTVADFPLFVGGTPVISGESNSFATGSHLVTETTDDGYTHEFSGDCDVDGNVSVAPGENKICIIINDDIGASGILATPPLIELIKVPDPLNIPVGPGPVTYTFTLNNIGTVTATNIEVIDDSCSPLVLVSGDTNANAELEESETWTYTCTMNLAQTHTNTAVATAMANGIMSTDIASATVVVDAAAVPPLIHVTKIPSSFLIPSVSDGEITYTLSITNPGTVPLSNVTLADNKCSPLTFVSGDANSDALLDPTETWTYTCTTNLEETTTNTALAVGEANGFIARDFALATVVVADVIPGLPNTGAIPYRTN